MFYDDFDLEYEQFRENTGHITDFPMHQDHVYRIAVQKYNTLKGGAVLLEVKDGYNKGAGGLYDCCDFDDLSDFWRIFETVEKELK